MGSARWRADRLNRSWHYRGWSVLPVTRGDRWGKLLHWAAIDPLGKNIGNFERLFDAKRAVENQADDKGTA